MVKRMKKHMCVLLAVMLFVGCFGVDVKASEVTTYATGKFTVTVQAGKEERAKTSFPLEAGEIVTILKGKMEVLASQLRLVCVGIIHLQ